MVIVEGVSRRGRILPEGTATMGPWVLVCSGCGARIRTARPGAWAGRACPTCSAPLSRARIAEAPIASTLPTGWLGLAVAVLGTVLGSVFLLTSPEDTRPTIAPGVGASRAVLRDGLRFEPQPVMARVEPKTPAAVIAPVERASPRPPERPSPPPPHRDDPLPPPPASVPLASNPPPPPPRPAEAVVLGPKRVRVGDEHGRPLVARVYGGDGSKVVMLPDGSLGWPNRMVFTDEPFRPFDADELEDRLLRGEFRGFRVLRTPHYLIVHHTESFAFARDSGTLLESLYAGLLKAFKERGLNVHEAEFPLVAVIYRTEREFRDAGRSIRTSRRTTRR